MRKLKNVAFLTTIALLCATLVLIGCKDDSSSGTKDKIVPTATISQSSGVISSSQAITVTFNEEMLATSLILGGSMATESSTSWSSDNLTVTISPVSKWTAGTAKTLTVDATDKAGNAVVQITASFTIDDAAPGKLSESPASGTTIISAQSIVVTFSESMSATVTLGGIIGTATSAWSTTTTANDTLTISPSTEWTAGSSLTLTISGSDANGVALSQITLTYTVVASKYVASTGSGSTCTKAAPCATIQAGIDSATSGRVLVAQGTYSVAGKVAVMKEGVSLYGGYKTADWSTRNVTTYTTTLTNSDNTTAGTSTDPVETVEFDGTTTAINSATILDGFTINASNADRSATIFIHADANSASPVIQYCTLQGGTDSPSGVKVFYTIYIKDTSEPTIQNNVIKGGTIYDGGSLGIYNSNVTSHATISNNTIYFANISGSGFSWLLYEGGSGTNDFKAITNNTFSTSGITGVTLNTNAWYMRDDGSNKGALGDTVSVGIDGLTTGTLSSFGNTAQN